MTIEEFNKLQENDKIYIFEEPSVHFYFSINERVTTKTIDFILEIEDGNNIYALKEGGLLYPSTASKIFTNLDNAKQTKINALKKLYNNNDSSEKIKLKIEKIFKKIGEIK